MMKGMNYKKIVIVALSLSAMVVLDSCIKNTGELGMVNRFEQELFELSTDTEEESLKDLMSKYPRFFPVFCNDIIAIGPDTSRLLREHLNQFLSDPVIISIKEKTDSVYSDMSGYAKNIHDGISGFGRLMLSNDSLKLVSFISGFNQSFVTLPGILGLGLDNYLGSDTEYYQQLGIPKYIRQTMGPEYLRVDAVRAWILSEIPPPSGLNTLLDHMIYEGKILFLLNESLKLKSENTTFRYSEEQLVWCLENEASMWEFIIENEFLYSTNRLLINRLTKEAPFIREFGPESPGRAGSWIGYRIVQSFMKRSGTSAPDLLMIEESKEILSESRYRPK